MLAGLHNSLHNVTSFSSGSSWKCVSSYPVYIKLTDCISGYSVLNQVIHLHSYKHLLVVIFTAQLLPATFLSL